MKQLVLKLNVNDEQVLNIALGRIARISGNYNINMNKITKLCTVTGDNIDPIQIVRKLRMLCPVYMVAVETPKEPEKKKEELVEEVVKASSLAAAVGPSKEPKKEDELRKEEPTKQEELVEEVVNASSRAAAAGPSKEPKKEDELRKEEPTKQEELVEEVSASSRAAAAGPSKEPKKKEEELEEEEPKKQEEKKKGEELLTDVKEDPNKTFRARQMTMKKAVLKLDLHDEEAKKKAMVIVSGLPGVDSIHMDMKDKKMTVIGDIDAEQIVTTLKKLCLTEINSIRPGKEPGEHYEDPVAELFKAYKSYMVADETLKDPEKKKEELVEEVVKASSLAAAVGPSKEPKKEDELRKEEPTKQEELVEEVVNASSRAAAAGPSKKPMKEDELRKEEPMKQEELVEEVVSASSRAAAAGPSKEPKKKEEELEEEEPKKQEEKKKGEELLTDVKEDPNKTFRAMQMTMMKAVLKLDLHGEKAKKKAMVTACGLSGVESVSIEMKNKKMTVTGDIDPVHLVAKLRVLCHTEIITVGPAKEPEKKKEEPKKQEEKKKGEELLTDVKEDPNKTFRARQMTMKKAVLKLVDLHDEKAKKKAMMTACGLSGVESVSIEMKNKKMTVTGDIDPVHLVVKLRELCHAEIITVGPAKEPEKKDPADPVGNYLPYHPQMPHYTYYASHVEDVKNNQDACVIS